MADKKIIDKILDIILKVVTPSKIILFGSQARGDAREDSDYDILVLIKNLDDLLQTKNSIYMNLYDVGAQVDVIVSTLENAEKSRKLKCSVTKEALLEGKVIYEGS